MKWLNSVFMIGLLLVNLSIYADQPYSSIRNLPATPYFVQDGYILYDLISTHNAGIIVDVESQDGSVARYIAQQASHLPSLNRIYSVNGWTSCDKSKQHLFQRFLSNVKQENTAELIIPIRMTSNEAAWALDVQADFISLVGANDKDIIYRDILAWYPHLANGGVLCGNNWYENSVEIGVTKAAESLGLNLKLNNNVWYFEKNAI